MALPAIGTKCRVVLIVILVARITVRFRVLEGGRDVTLFTGCRCMHSQKREVGYVMIEDNAVGPAVFIVTALALFTFLTVMHIITEVATVTLKRQVLFVQFAAMACRAAQIRMLAFKGEFSVFAVIETCAFPVFFIVAGVAVFTISAAMLVINPVAAVAVFTRFNFCYRLFMAGCAGNVLVFAF